MSEDSARVGKSGCEVGDCSRQNRGPQSEFGDVAIVQGLAEFGWSPWLEVLLSSSAQRRTQVQNVYRVPPDPVYAERESAWRNPGSLTEAAISSKTVIDPTEKLDVIWRVLGIMIHVEPRLPKPFNSDGEHTRRSNAGGREAVSKVNTYARSPEDQEVGIRNPGGIFTRKPGKTSERTMIANIGQSMSSKNESFRDIFGKLRLTANSAWARVQK
ncbi:hypothetical protein K438DRAFT_1931429 [Mycena galopus ATCC 62051]|nr:hypothetical protein K438DRAFT_1931429 [Mycena galopus ATCC 62051]